MTLVPRPYRIWWRILGPGGVLVLLGLALGLRTMQAQVSHAGGALPVPTAVDARLVLRPHPAPFGGALGPGVTLSGAVSPGLPGVTAVHLGLRLPGGRAARGGRVRLVLTMPGMAMAPLHATLIADGNDYRGSVALPMFGSYRAQVEAATGGGRYTGAVALTLPLALRPASGEVDGS